MQTYLLFYSTKLDKGPSSSAGNMCNKLPSACWKADISDNQSTSDSIEFITGKICSWKSIFVIFV